MALVSARSVSEIQVLFMHSSTGQNNSLSRPRFLTQSLFDFQQNTEYHSFTPKLNGQQKREIYSKLDIRKILIAYPERTKDWQVYCPIRSSLRDQQRQASFEKYDGQMDQADYTFGQSSIKPCPPPSQVGSKLTLPGLGPAQLQKELGQRRSRSAWQQHGRTSKPLLGITKLTTCPVRI